MSLFALRREYQRSIDRMFEDFSVHARVQTELSPGEVESNRRWPALSMGNNRGRHVQRKVQNTNSRRAAGGHVPIHHNAKAWACLLDSKKRKQ